MSANPSPDPLISLFAAIRTYAEVTALPAPAIHGLRQFFRQMTPTRPTTENQDARVLYPSLLDHDDPDERPNDTSGTRITSRGTQTPAARTATSTNNPLAPDNADLRNLWRCCPALPRHACYSATREDNIQRWRFHCSEHIPHNCPDGWELRRAREAREAARRNDAPQRIVRADPGNLR